jgi:hypothetical protein
MTAPERPTSPRPVDYRGEPLEAGRGPGLGCFWLQLGVLAFLLVLTPLTVAWDWPSAVSAILLFLVLILLLLAGQSVIFLLRLLAADRRGGSRRRPLASPTPTVGELEDAQADPALANPAPEPADPAPADPAATTPDTTAPTDPRTTDPGVRE